MHNTELFIHACKYYGESEVPGKESNPTIMQWIKNILPWADDEIAWCLSGDVEVLTDKGFKRFDEFDVNSINKVAQINKDNLCIEYVENFGFIQKTYSGEVYSLKKYGFYCDPNHRFFAKAAKNYLLKPISRLSSAGYPIPNISSGKEDCDISDNNIKLLAIFLSDGYRKFRRKFKVRVAREHKISFLDNMPYVLRNEHSQTHRGRKDTVEYDFKTNDEFNQALSKYKILKQSFIHSLSRRQARLFIDTYSLFDGTRKSGGYELYTACKKLQMQLNTIAVLAGYKPTPFSTKMVSKNSNIDYLHIVYVGTNTFHRYILPHHIERLNVKNDTLYCLSVPSEVFVIRTPSGVIMPTGNCSMFMANMAKDLELEYPLKNTASARSWLNVGEAVTDGPMIGDVCVFWRVAPDSWQGHVALYVRETEKFIWVLGGNQSDQVNIRPYAKSRLLSIRRLRKAQTDDQA